MNEGAVSWFKSYLSERSQHVYLEGSLSDPLSISAGVPQGSVLGPLLYILYTNDLPETVHQHLGEGNSFYNVHCNKCGGICSFADDSTLTISRSSPEELNEVVDQKYKEVERYMEANKLVLNSEKTHMLVMATPYQHTQHQNFDITLDTGTEIIEPTYSEKLLGAYITNDFKFNNHLKDNENSVFKTLTSRVNALSKISKFSNFKTRKMVANGIVMSKLIYLIQWWGGCSDFLIEFLQVLQNRAAGLVTNCSRYTPTAIRLNQCGWLSVRQLVHYHSLVLAHSMKIHGRPEYFKKHFRMDFPYQTRLAAGQGIRRGDRSKHQVTRNSFVARTSSAWNQLPAELRTEKKTKKFKSQLKSWIKENLQM